MWQVFSWFIVGIIYGITYCRLYAYLNGKTKFKVSLKMLLLILVMSCLYVILMKTHNQLRPIIINICLIVVLYLCSQDSLAKVIVSIILLSVLNFIGEAVFFNLIVNPGYLPYKTAVYHPIGILITNISIFSIFIGILFFPKIKDLIRGIIKWYSEKELVNSVILSIIAIGSIAIISYQLFGADIELSYVIVVNAFLMCVIIFVIGYFKQKSKNYKLIFEYDQLLEYVRTYEELLTEKSKNQHEHKNQLILLRDMLSINDKNNKKAIDYLSELIGIQQCSVDDKNLLRLKNIPQGGLKGLLYYKIRKMQENRIDVFVNISNELEKRKNWKSCEKNLTDVSRLIGVYLDNAIEACLDAENKFIIIEADLVDGQITFSFSNTYKGMIEINKLDNEGFTTKKLGKGYGLALAKDILIRNKNLKQEREMNGMYYVQKLIIK